MNDYKEEIRILQEALANKKLVLFVGSGVSLSSGMPSWSNAVSQISEKLSLGKDNADDNLLIPQLYFNWRGKKEYVELMRRIFRFNENLPVSESHRKIISLNTHHIITTNYDNLLEKAAEENREMVQTIVQDKDLPYKTVEREIIKMHGDFEHDNFVLKELDYLQYSKNFPMLEVYIKSLIATNIVLFVGYSFADPDVRQLFKWVKDVLDEDFQRAYLFQVHDEYDAHMLDYYKNMGINIIYASEISGYKDKDESAQLCSFLDDLKDLNKDDSYIEQTYKNCLEYSELHYIKLIHIPKLFPDHTVASVQNQVLRINVEDDGSAINSIFESNDNKGKTIVSLLEKSMLTHIDVVDSKHNNSGTIEIKRGVYESLTNSVVSTAVNNFDYAKIKELISSNECNLSDNNPEVFLQQAYLYYFLRDYIKSYQYLGRSSELYYKKKQYAWYFISEFNRYNVGCLLCDSYNIKEDIRRKVKTDIDSIDLDGIYDRIPAVSNVSKSLLKDIYTYRMYYAEFQRIYRESNAALEETKTQYISKSHYSYESLRCVVEDSYNFELFNYIMFDQYIEKVETYRLYAKTIITSSRSIDIVSNDSLFGVMSISNVHAPCLESFDIRIILKYFTYRELNDFLSEYNPKLINLSDPAIEYLELVCGNLSACGISENDYYWKCLCLLSSTSMNSSLVKAILESLVVILVSNVNLWIYHRVITKLIFSINEQHLFDNNNLDLLESIIDKLLIIKTNSEQKPFSIIDELLAYCLRITFEHGRRYYSDIIYRYSKEEDYLFLPTIYTYVDSKTKTRITNTLKGWKWSNNDVDVEVYTRMVITGLLDSNANIETDMISLAYSRRGLSIKSIPDPEQSILNNILTLYLHNKIINVSDVESLLNSTEDEVIAWLSNINDYNYDNFKIDWLLNCSKGLLISIAENEIANSQITIKIKQAYLDGNITNKRIIELYFRYFVNPI